MRKFNVLLLLVVFSVALFAQRANLPKAPAMKSAKGQVEVKYLGDPKNVEIYGDTIVYDNFGSGTATTLPTGWTSVDLDTYQMNGYLWKWTNVGATGPTTTGYEHVLAATTAANGWMIFDSDLYGSGSYDACLISPSYDLTLYPNVALYFEELYKRWGTEAANPYGGNPTWVGFSVDGGTTWTDVELHADFATKDETDNPGVVMMNVSNIIGNQANVKVRFRMQGLWDYWWQIDDFKLIVGPENNIVTLNELVSNMEEYPTGYGFSGYYSLTPLSQVMPVFFQADMWNNGSNMQTNVNMHFEVKNAAGTVVHTADIDTVQLSFDSTYVAATGAADYFIPTVADVYSVNYAATQTQSPDDVPSDNVAGPISFEVWDNNVFARDVVFTQAVSPEFYTGGTDGDFMGNDYFVRNAAKVTSLSVLLDYRTDLNTTMIGQVYTFNTTSGAREIKIQSEDFVVDTTAIGQWVTLPLIVETAGDDDIADQTLCTAGIEFYFGADQLWIAGDDEGPHIYSLANALRLGTTWYYFDFIPFIRMNLEGAVLPPSFMTWGDTLACVNQLNSWVVKVVDPQGLPVTIEGTTLPSWIASFTDHGNGYATMTGTPTTAGKVGNFVELTASNGQNENKQYYVINATTGTTNCKNEVYTVPGAINENPLAQVSVFPNPSTGIITVSNAEKASIMVYNMIGDVVASVNNASVNQTIDLSGFNAGAYLVKVISDRFVTTEKVNLLK